MVSFIPKFCPLSLSDAQTSALSNTPSYETDMDAARGEYIFLLDRSGSMDGVRIRQAVAALTLFLKSLPVDTYFNVVSFGSSSRKLHPQSQRNCNETIASAIAEISKYTADLGGTEIEAPLKDILQSPVIDGYPKQIFLLTDGEVGSTQRVIDLVHSHTKHARVHTIGIGNGASLALIRGCAEKGKGEYCMISDQEPPAAKIIQLLEASLSAVISRVQLDYDETVVESVVPNPKQIPYVLKNEVLNFYLTFRGQLQEDTRVRMSYVDSRNQLPFGGELLVQAESPSEAFVDKMGHFRTIRAMEES